MATTTFNGTVRSDGDIKATTKNTTTGAFVDYAVIKAAGGCLLYTSPSPRDS